MKNRNILFLSGAVVLLGIFFVYWHFQDLKNNKKDNNKNVPEKVESKTDASVKNNKNSGVTESSTVANISGTIYYYGEECPHCENVIAYLDQNDIYNKVKFVKKEVWHNQENGKELTQAATKCGLDPKNIGVPFVYSEGKCYMGDPDVIDFFAKAAGIKK
ncbi:MAG: hypothetical protein WC682_04535 [Parcubacteria group bacterium]|jgi:glutaredoxin